MSTLVAIGYNDPYKAEEVRLMLRKMKKEYLLDLEDAVVAVKDEKGTPVQKILGVATKDHADSYAKYCPMRW